MEHEISTFTASDGYALRYRHWRPTDERPAGYVVALHGIQSHSGWYEYSSGRLCESGFDVRFLDRRGSGLNEPDRGHAPHHERLIGDVAQFLAEVRHDRDQTAPASPVVLLGVSWGGKLAAVTCARRPELVDALALLYPGICARIGPRLHERFLLQLAMRVGAGRRKTPIPLDDPALFTGQAEWQRFIRDDPLALREATVAFMQASCELDRLARRAPDRIRCPVLMMLAGNDRIIDNAASRRYVERIASADRRLIEYPEAAHTLEFEPNRDEFVNDLIAWLASVRHRG